MGVNLNSLRVEFAKQILDSNRYKGLAKGAALSRVRAAQNEMVEEFEGHKVTQELEGGATYSGPSIVSYHADEKNANLFSFIGFPSGSNPVEILRELLKFPIDVRTSTRSGNTYYFKVLVPTVEDIEKATPMPSEYTAGTFSWARGVEDGDLIGAQNFLSIETSASRSGGGIQVKFKLDNSIEKTPYITDILEAFRKRLEQIV